MAELRAVQQVRRMRGGSQSQLMRASDGNFYIVKFTNNPQCKRILANELIASRLGSLLGLPVPEANVIEVDEWLIENTPDLCFDNAGLRTRCQAGKQLAIRYVANPFESHVFDYLPESLFPRVRNLHDFARILVFDKWTGNCDGRQAVFTKQPKQRDYSAAFIDHGYCFNAGEWNFPDSALRGVYSRNSVYEYVKGWQDFEPTLSRAEAITVSELFEITKDIPIEWWAHLNTSDMTRLLFELSNRRTMIRNLITSFRTSTRNPFPNWLS
jgi:hypothetical protein